MVVVVVLLLLLLLEEGSLSTARSDTGDRFWLPPGIFQGADDRIQLRYDASGRADGRDAGC